MNFFTQVITNTVAVDAGTAHSDYPVINLLTRDKFEQFRTESGSTTTVDLLIDFGSAKTCDYILLGDKNYDGQFNLYVDAADTGGGWDTAVTSSQCGSESTVVQTFNSASKRYWLLRLATFTNETDYVANVFLGSSYSTPKECQLEFSEVFNQGLVERYRLSHYEVRYKRQDSTKSYTNMVLRGLSEAQVLAFMQEFNDNCNGVEEPFYFLEDDASTYTLMYFNQSQLGWTHILTDYYEIPLSLVEAI